jgi:hypothetical protein
VDGTYSKHIGLGIAPKRSKSPSLASLLAPVQGWITRKPEIGRTPMPRDLNVTSRRRPPNCRVKCREEGILSSACLKLVYPRQYSILLASESPVSVRSPQLATTSGMARPCVPDRSPSRGCAHRAICRRTARFPRAEPTDDQQPSVCCYGLATLRENGDAALVIPVMQDIRE